MSHRNASDPGSFMVASQLDGLVGLSEFRGKSQRGLFGKDFLLLESFPSFGKIKDTFFYQQPITV